MVAGLLSTGLTAGLAACTAVGGLLPDRGDGAERIDSELRAAGIGVQAASAASAISGTDRNVHLGVWLYPEVELTAELVKQVLIIAVPLMDEPGVRNIELDFHHAPPLGTDDEVSSGSAVPDLMASRLDVSAARTELLEQWSGGQEWAAADTDPQQIRAPLRVLREYVEQEGR